MDFLFIWFFFFGRYLNRLFFFSNETLVMSEREIEIEIDKDRKGKERSGFKRKGEISFLYEFIL